MRVPINKVKIPNDNCEALAEAVSRGTARIVSDGSFDPDSKRGTAALFMTSGESKLNLLKAAIWTFGHKEDQSAYRSELTGVILGLSIIATMVEYFDLTKGEVEFAFDNKSGEHKVKNLTEDIHITNKCFDLLQDIKHLGTTSNSSEI